MIGRFRLDEALHARPADLFVRLAQRQPCGVAVTRLKTSKRVDGKSILGVLSLGVPAGEEIEVSLEVCDGNEAARAQALDEIRELFERKFDRDLVPETGESAAPGIAIGTALVVIDEVEEERPSGSVEEESARFEGALARARHAVEGIVAALLPKEAALFAPELAILRDLAPEVRAMIARGVRVEEAVRASTRISTSDLFADARARLLDALGADFSERLARALAAQQGEIILVVDALTPSLVASLPPHVVGVVAAAEAEAPRSGESAPQSTSHAAILARGRGLPLLLVEPHVGLAITDGELVIVDTTLSPPRLWVTPNAHTLADARARRDALHAFRTSGVGSTRHLGISLRVNVGARGDEIPEGADGVGLLRTELVFADRARPPSHDEQHGALLAAVERARGRPVVVRLFDGGGDKPLRFMPAPLDDLGARGFALLMHHPSVLDAQLAALRDAARAGDVRVLIPLVRDAADVLQVRARLEVPLAVGAMIETPEAVTRVDEIAEVADFLSIGTNDLASLALGVDRARAASTLDARLVPLLDRIVQAAHARARKVTLCGELAAVPSAARVFVGLGIDALSVAPPRLAALSHALADATREGCEAEARALRSSA